MDGPNVNLKFCHNLFQERKGEELPDLLNIGSFKKEAKESGWNLGNTLWQIFYDTLARREVFIQITDSDLFLLWFCQHRLAEDIKVAEQALKIWPRVNKYVKTVKSERKAGVSAFFVFVATARDGTVIKAKLEFFVAVAKPLQEFLLKFQTEAPMTPFLVLSLKDLLLATIGCFFKKVLEKADTSRSYLLLTLLTKRNKKPKAC